MMLPRALEQAFIALDWFHPSPQQADAPRVFGNEVPRQYFPIGK